MRFSSRLLQGVTIGIRNWNHEYLLGRSINSALRAVADLQQHGVPAEVLIIDDGSRDGSSTLIRQLEALYFERGLRAYLNKTRSGSRSTMLLYLAMGARYKYLFILDADDELIPSSLLTLYKAISMTSAAIVYGNIIRVKSITDGEQDEIEFFSNRGYQDSIFHVNHICATSLVDLSQIIDVGGYTDEIYHEDWEMLLHLGTIGRLVVFVPVVVAYYYDLPSSAVRGEHEGIYSKAKRIYDQLGIRENHLLRTRHLIFHPDVGYLTDTEHLR